MTSETTLLEILIPAYKRPDSLVRALESVVMQVEKFSLYSDVKITVADDKSPIFDRERFLEFKRGNELVKIEIEVNESNLGMSENIFRMVDKSQAEFCTILTDDDWIQPDALEAITLVLKMVRQQSSVGGVYTPRYSYREDGELNSIACRRFDSLNLIGGNSLDAIKYCHDGFVLTGLVFRRRYFSRKQWLDNIENAYFPVINFGHMLSCYQFLYLNVNWFHHTVLNECHWERWGKDDSERNRRKYRDYMYSLSLVADIPKTKGLVLFNRLLSIYYEYVNYKNQLKVQRGRLSSMEKLLFTLPLTRRRAPFLVALVVDFLSSIPQARA